MTLTDCQLLSIVAQLGTFAAAAERLHITPSAVSHAVSGVEAECGFPLFTRTKSGVTLTITAPQDDICGCALLVYALRDLGLGLYNLGSGGAVGRGYIKVSRIAIACGDKTADMTFGVDGCKLNDTDNLVSAWLHALEERT